MPPSKNISKLHPPCPPSVGLWSLFVGSKKEFFRKIVNFENFFTKFWKLGKILWHFLDSWNLVVFVSRGMLSNCIKKNPDMSCTSCPIWCGMFDMFSINSGKILMRFGYVQINSQEGKSIQRKKKFRRHSAKIVRNDVESSIYV